MSQRTKTKEKEAKARSRAREKAQREAEREVKQKARQKVIAYDEQGRRIGDDGYLMTKARTRLHHLYNACFIIMILSFVVAVVFIALSYFQGQQLSHWELIAYGGNQFNGWSVANMLRVEALCLLFVAAICLFANIKGMGWLYDGAPYKPVRITMLAMGIVSGLFFLVALFTVGIPEPFSLIMVIIAVLMNKFTVDVAAEKGSLRPAKIAKTVVKKG